MKKLFSMMLMAAALPLAATNVHVSTNSQLSANLQSATSPDTIIVDADFDVYSMNCQGAHVLDVNGHTLSLVSALRINDASLTITGDGTFLRHKDNSFSNMFSITGGNVIIENGEFISKSSSQPIIDFRADDAANTTLCNLTIKGGYFESANQCIHLQAASTGTHTLTVKGGVFVGKHSYMTAIGGASSDHTAITVKKGVFAHTQAGKPFYFYDGQPTTLTIPAGSTYVLDGSWHANIAEAIGADALTSGMVLYVADDTNEFSLFNLMGNSNASTNVMGITSGGHAYGHQAHSALFVHATAASGYDGITFRSAPASTLKVHDLGNDNYCIMPYTPGMTLSAIGNPKTVSAINITTKDGCIPAVGEHFWARKTTVEECRTMLDWSEEHVYVSVAYWVDGEGNMLEGAATCEAGQTYYLRLEVSPEWTWEWANPYTITVNGTALTPSWGAVKWPYTAAGAPTALESVEAAPKAQKVIENGKLYILRNGQRYTAAGVLVK